MAKMPKRTIKDMIDEIEHVSYPRPHLGGSVIGHPCRRYLLYHFRWAYMNKIEARIERIFRLGDAIEIQIVKALESIDIEVKPQVKVTSPHGFGGGTADGILNRVPDLGDNVLFEAKSMNHTNFQNLTKKGVLAAFPKYYAQMQMYMGRLELEFGLFVAMNKNTSELYFEKLPFDQVVFETLCDTEVDVLMATHIEEFPRLSNYPNWHQCKFCEAQDVCHNEAPVKENCRTCEHAEMREPGQWVCLQSEVNLTPKMQEEGCGIYERSSMWK